MPKHKLISISLEFYKTSLEILSKTPENWLEFSAGQNTETNLKRFRTNSFFSFVRQSLGYFYFLFRSFSTKQNKIGNKDVLFFGTSNNQFTVLESIFKEQSRFSSAFVLPNNCRGSFNHTEYKDLYYVKLKLGFFFIFLVLTIKRIPKLFMLLWKTDRRLFLHRIKSFLLIYYWLIFNQALLRDINPKILMLSNDHNPEMRVMIELCKHLQIKTSYVQHASVSKRFHSLDFNYSFLDGQHALDIYMNCDKRRSPNSNIVDNRICYLVGNLRRFDINKLEDIKHPKLGLALKGTDSIKTIINILEKLTLLDDVIVRPHPNLNFNKIWIILKRKFKGNILLSDPKFQSASDFINEISIFISGNSTLLLEVAAAGRSSVYIEELSGGVNDYYGFVERQVCDCYKDIDEFIDSYNKQNQQYKFVPNKGGITYFWDSYDKSYFNQEGKIVSNLLAQIITDSSNIKLDFPHKKEVL